MLIAKNITAFYFLFLSLGFCPGFIVEAQQTEWVKQLAGKDAFVRPLGLFPFNENSSLLLYKTDHDVQIGRTLIPVVDSSTIKALLISQTGEISIPDTIPSELLKSLPSVNGNRWLLKSKVQNGNYFLAYGLSTPLRLPTNLNWSLAFLDGNGHRLWEFHLPENQQVEQLEILPGGKCLVIGNEKKQRGDLNIFFSLWNEYGQEVWRRSMGGKSDDAALSASHDAEGNLFISGYFSADSSFLGNTRDLSGKEKDGFITCYDLKGNEKFFYRQRGDGFNSVNYLLPSSLGKVWFVSVVQGKDWRLPPFGFPRTGKQDLVIGMIDPKLGKENENPLRVFPNPAHELVYFGLEKPVSKGPMKATIHRKDGTVLQQMKISGTPGSSFRFNVSNTKPGAYFITVKGKGKSITQRVVVE